MTTAHQRAAVLTSMLLCSASTLAAKPAESIGEMFTEGTATVNLRYRYEYVDQDSLPENAKASTLRSRLTLQSAPYQGFSVGLEMDHVGRLGAQRYRTPTNGKTRYPVVADPDGFDLNQAYLRYESDQWTASAGRQRILHAGQRFLGGVAWRQNEQTYDSFRLQVQPLPGLNFDYSYLWDVNRIFGPDTPTPANLQRRFDSDSHAVYVSYQLNEKHSIGAFGYLLDFDNNPFLSSQTYGFDYKGSLGPVTLQASLARQADYGDNTTDYAADYHFAEVSVPWKGFTFAAGREVLGSDNGNASFMTPLATLHKFQGWADAFLVTPAAGVRDHYVKVATKLGKVKLAGLYHQYDPDDGSGDFGDETNLVATYPFHKNWSAQVKYADFDAENFSADMKKLWFTLSFTY